ncbi:sigma 54-interacting transcriptional regulator [Ampullimonas aquatilis]|uniref:sigma 54-interacting transcriptional regulator n=1 Tax=Ampullimonas aquatilis TaxID=1341549 RepID=UPI003C77A7C2
MLGRILIVDDDASLLKLLALRLEAEGYEVRSAEDGQRALLILQSFAADLVVSDLRMDGMDGLGLFAAIQRDHSGIPVIILTAHGSIPDAVQATRMGVSAFLTKPFEAKALLAEIERLIPLGSRTDNALPAWRLPIVTRNPKMEALLDVVERLGRNKASVLITGPSGAGKELIATAIHAAGLNDKAPFIAVNCGAVPEPLLESELFGYVKGAFTGAVRDNPGLIRSADGGTLFLDEIGDMPLALQVKLLRVLQERKVRPVGGTQEKDVDVRLITATHRNLSEEMSQGRFREDLYYRLNVVTLEVPALAERREDIPLLAQHFARTIAEKYRCPVPKIASDAMELLMTAPWPGNVRQLYNVIEQSVALADIPAQGSEGAVITGLRIREALRDTAGNAIPSLADAKTQFERDYLVQILRMTEGNVAQAALIAQRNRTEFYRLMQKHGLDAQLFKGND